MEFFRIHRTIPFMRYSLILNGISVLTFLIAVGFLIGKGLHLSIEFTGGTVMEVSYQQPADLEKIRAAIEAKGWGETQVQNFGTSRDVLIRIPLREGVPSGQQAEQVMATLKGIDTSADLRRVEFVGPQVGAELAHDGALALLIVVIGIMIYLAFRFEWKFSVAAIVANLHDVVLVIGMFAIFDWEFSLPVLAAVLAVLGYSVNESVIIFDRVREHFKKYRKMSTIEVIDSAITATIAHDHHPRLHAGNDAGHAVLRRAGAALFRAGADDRHLLRRVLLGVRCRRDRHVPGGQARGPDQADQEGRSGGGDRSVGNAAARARTEARARHA
jgi:preprotein translocase subunit SecF